VHDISVIVLTMGNRPRELDTAIRSARRQVGVGVEVVVVGNGTSVDSVDADHRVELPENVGIPEGRNIGMAAGHHEFACFLDDDAEFMGDDVLARALGRLADDSDLAVIGLRLVDETLRSDRRHDPRLRTASHSVDRVTSFPGGACVVRGSAFDAVGGLAGGFFYALEETDLAWRLLDAGWGICYEADLLVRHTAVDPHRHPEFARRTARNRAWLAHRNLPWALAAAYLTTWTFVTGARSVRRPRDLLAHLEGLGEGLRRPLGPRRPMSWRTALRMTRLGRPPIV
jgi:hypothetical protein